MSNQVARFRVNQQLHVVGIGLILTGEIIQGKIAYQNQIRLACDQQEAVYMVIDVETIEYMTAGTSETALILELVEGDKDVNHLERITGKVIEINE